MKIVITNTTEVGIQLKADDDIYAAPPASFPAKLLAFLYHRFLHFAGSDESGMIIIPTELITDNAIKLKQILIELAYINNLDAFFIKWLDEANDFCNSLVDRIVPGDLPKEEQLNFESMAGYTDELTIMSEPYSLWAIETANKKTIEALSFSKADSSIIIAPHINKYRELKLRLLNATHTVCCGLAHLSGFVYVCNAMQNESFRNFIMNLMLNEIVPSITSNYITEEEAKVFAHTVAERFSNPFIHHKWISIAVQYTAKFRMRVIPLLKKYYETRNEFPQCIMAGFAAYIFFMKAVKKNNNYYSGNISNMEYKIEDDKANWFYEVWKNNDENTIAEAVTFEKEIWESDLDAFDNLSGALQTYIHKLQNKNPEQVTQYISQLNYTSSIHS